MKKSVKRLLFLIFFVVGITSVSRQTVAASTDISPDIDKIKKSGVLRIAVPADDLMAFYEEDGEGNFSGVDIDIAKGLADSLGVKPKFVRVSGSFDNMTEALKNDEVDVIVGTYSRSYDRMSYIDFSKPYLSLRFAVMVNKKAMIEAKINSNPIPYMKENNVSIALLKGTSHVDIVKQLFPKATIVEVDSYEEADNMAKKGKVFAAFCTELEFFSRYLAQPDYSLYVTTYCFNDVKDDFVIAVNRDSQQFKKYVDLYLDTMRPVTIKDVKEKYYEYFK